MRARPKRVYRGLWLGIAATKGVHGVGCVAREWVVVRTTTTTGIAGISTKRVVRCALCSGVRRRAKRVYRGLWLGIATALSTQ